MSRRPRWFGTPPMALVLLLAGAAGCDGSVVEANDVDRQRIEIMRGDPAFAQVAVDEIVPAAAGPRPDDNRDNAYVGFIDLSPGAAAGELAPELAREQATGILAELHQGGWAVNRVQCEVEVAGGEISLAWEAHGHRVHDGVTYRFWLEVLFPPPHVDIWPTGVRLTMLAPLHTHDTFGVTPATTVPAGDSCLERGKPPIPDGTGAPGHDVVSDGSAVSAWLGPDGRRSRLAGSP